MKTVKDSITKGLKEAIEFEKGKQNGTRRRVVMISPITHYSGDEIKNIRQNLGLTQIAFSELMGVSIKTVEAWEAGKNIPQGPAQRILQLLITDSSMIKQFIFAG